MKYSKATATINGKPIQGLIESFELIPDYAEVIKKLPPIKPISAKFKVRQNRWAPGQLLLYMFFPGSIPHQSDFWGPGRGDWGYKFFSVSFKFYKHCIYYRKAVCAAFGLSYHYSMMQEPPSDYWGPTGDYKI